MAKLSVSEASKRFHVSRPTLQKALKDGTISGIRATHNGVETWQIDTSELARVYKARSGKDGEKFDRPDDGFPSQKTAVFNPLPEEVAAEIEGLRRALEAAKEAAAGEALRAAVEAARAEERLAQIDHMKRELETARQEKAALIGALPKPEQEKPQEKIPNRSFWRSLFGGQS